MVYLIGEKPKLYTLAKKNSLVGLTQRKKLVYILELLAVLFFVIPSKKVKVFHNGCICSQ